MQRRHVLAGAVFLAAVTAGCAPVQGVQRPGLASARPSAHARTERMARDHAHCIRDTGTLIRHRDGRCLGQAGRSYSAAELRRTGAVDVGQALRMLDPSIY